MTKTSYFAFSLGAVVGVGVYAFAVRNRIPGQKPVNRGYFDPAQLRRGIEVEQEHSSNLHVAETISRQHLEEMPDYYSRLDRMEKTGKKALAGPQLRIGKMFYANTTFDCYGEKKGETPYVTCQRRTGRIR